MSQQFALRLSITALAAAAIACGHQAHAQTIINQDRVMSGSVTPGDGPGFPLTISVPGSYKLSSNLVVPGNVNGIEITVNNVTIDLNGYAISGPFGCTGYGTTLVCTSGQGNGIAGPVNGTVPAYVTLKNGTVKGFAGTGVALGGQAQIDSMRITQNGFTGLNLSDANISGSLVMGSTVTNTLVSNNGSSGLVSDGRVVVSHSEAFGNRGHGFYLSGESIATGLVSAYNSGYAFMGSSSSAVSNSVLSGNKLGTFWGATSMGNNRCSGNAC